MLLHNGNCDEAEDIVQNILSDDIEDRNARELLTQVVNQKFKMILGANSASSDIAEFSFSDLTSMCLSKRFLMDFSKEEILTLKIKLIKSYCNRLENRALFLLPNDVLFKALGSLYLKTNNLKFALACYYMMYIVESSILSRIGKTQVLRYIAKCHRKMGNFNKARKVLTMALNIHDPIADPDEKLFNRTAMCQLQLDSKDIKAPVRTLEQIRNEAEQHGKWEIALKAENLLHRTHRFIYSSTHSTGINIM